MDIWRVCGAVRGVVIDSLELFTSYSAYKPINRVAAHNAPDNFEYSQRECLFLYLAATVAGACFFK